MSRRPTGTGMPLRGDRILRYVNAFCPQCHRADPDRPLAEVARRSGWLAERDGRVYLERGCPEHGMVRTLYDEHPEILAYLEEWTAPTKAHLPDTPGNFDPVPAAYLRGLPEMQTQHTCILLADIVEGCNLRCPTCFADSTPELAGVVAVADVLANVDQRLAREHGRLDVLMLSGGEPTLHPDLPTLLAELTARPITRILINTNGVRLARDESLVALLAEHRERVEVYLQYDGVSAAASRHHRGGDLRALKAEALRRLSGHGIFTTLVMTVALGVNDDEIGAVVRTALDTPFVGGVSLQPQFGSGRSGAIDPMHRLTHTGVLARLGPQTDGLVTWRDLTALPCSHPHCCSVGYLLRDDGRLALPDRSARTRHPQTAPRPGRQPHRRQRHPRRSAPGGARIPARAALGTVLAVAPRHRAGLADHLPALRSGHVHAADAGLLGAARPQGPPADPVG